MPQDNWETGVTPSTVNIQTLRSYELTRQIIRHRMKTIDLYHGRTIDDSYDDGIDKQLCNQQLLAHFIALEQMFNELERLPVIEAHKQLILFAQQPTAMMYDWAMARGWLDIKKHHW